MRVSRLPFLPLCGAQPDRVALEVHSTQIRLMFFSRDFTESLNQFSVFTDAACGCLFHLLLRELYFYAVVHGYLSFFPWLVAFRHDSVYLTYWDENQAAISSRETDLPNLHPPSPRMLGDSCSRLGLK